MLCIGANTTCSPNAGLSLYHRRRRWYNDSPSLGEHVAFARNYVYNLTLVYVRTKHMWWAPLMGYEGITEYEPILKHLLRTDQEGDLGGPLSISAPLYHDAMIGFLSYYVWHKAQGSIFTQSTKTNAIDQQMVSHGTVVGPTTQEIGMQTSLLQNTLYFCFAYMSFRSILFLSDSRFLRSYFSKVYSFYMAQTRKYKTNP